MTSKSGERPSRILSGWVVLGLLVVTALVAVLALTRFRLVRPGGVAVQFGAFSGRTAEPGMSRTGETIWAVVPLQAADCACETPPSARLYSTLKDWHLESGYHDGPIRDSHQYLSISFDPGQASRERIVKLIAANGGTVQPGPPPGAGE